MAEKRWAVIPTNIGWKRDGSNPMGAGVALAASELYPDLATWYGDHCQKYGANTAVCPYYEGNLILFPTKPLNVRQPWMSWQSPSDIDLIARGVKQLQKLGEILREKKLVFGEIALPLVGCGAGGLERAEVVPILKDGLDDRFVLLELT
jgi:hypothetical protein